jgi:hypothetical protein
VLNNCQILSLREHNTFIVRVLDDAIPESNDESVFVRLTGVEVTKAAQASPGE